MTTINHQMRRCAKINSAVFDIVYEDMCQNDEVKSIHAVGWRRVWIITATWNWARGSLLHWLHTSTKMTICGMWIYLWHRQRWNTLFITTTWSVLNVGFKMLLRVFHFALINWSDWTASMAKSWWILNHSNIVSMKMNSLSNSQNHKPKKDLLFCQLLKTTNTLLQKTD